MTAKNRANIQTEIDSLLADNGTGDISPSDVRVVHETSKDSNLNLLETTAQSVASPVNYTGDLQQNGDSVKPLEEVRINSAADWPTPTSIGGVSTIRLESKHYVINKPFSMTTPLAWPGAGLTTVIEARKRAIVTYTGTDSLFRDPDAEGDVEITGLTEWQAPNGDMWEITGSTGVWKFQAKDGPRFTDMNGMGTIDGNGVAQFNLEFGTLSNFDQGLVVIDPAFFEINDMFVFGNNAASSVYFTVQGASTVGSINFWGMTVANGTNETVFDLNTDIQSGIDIISINRCQQEGGLNGTVFKSGSLTEKSNKVLATGNSIVGDTVPGGLISLTNNTTETVISAVNTPTLVLGTYVVEDVSQFTGTTAGRLTSNIARTISRGVDVSISFEPASGNGKVIRAYVAKNGTEITNTGKSLTVDNGQPHNVSLFWREDTEENDFYEIFVENKTDAINVIAIDATLRIP